MPFKRKDTPLPASVKPKKTSALLRFSSTDGPATLQPARVLRLSTRLRIYMSAKSLKATLPVLTLDTLRLYFFALRLKSQLTSLASGTRRFFGKHSKITDADISCLGAFSKLKTANSEPSLI
jgi:hypothetical protein